MKLKSLALAASAITLWSALPALAQTEIQWWHSMTAVNNEWVNDLAKQFNESQKAYKIVPTYKGSYTDSFTAAIAANFSKSSTRTVTSNALPERRSATTCAPASFTALIAASEKSVR